MKNYKSPRSRIGGSQQKGSTEKYNYYPGTKAELRSLIMDLIEERGLEADLNDIDTSMITDMSRLFYFWRPPVPRVCPFVWYARKPYDIPKL